MTKRGFWIRQYVYLVDFPKSHHLALRCYYFATRYDSGRDWREKYADLMWR